MKSRKRGDDGFTPTTRPWRGLMRVECIGEEAFVVGLNLPGWNPHRTVYVNMSEIPEQALADITGYGVGYRFFAKSNKGEPDPTKLKIDFSTYEKV
ncbi:MAG: hypothetical protein WC796_04305 [Candidatus Pacearchaeota archaeon]|jgi:hypothetical protein